MTRVPELTGRAIVTTTYPFEYSPTYFITQRSQRDTDISLRSLGYRMSSVPEEHEIELHIAENWLRGSLINHPGNSPLFRGPKGERVHAWTRNFLRVPEGANVNDMETRDGQDGFVRLLGEIVNGQDRIIGEHHFPTSGIVLEEDPKTHFPIRTTRNSLSARTEHYKHWYLNRAPLIDPQTGKKDVAVVCYVGNYHVGTTNAMCLSMIADHEHHLMGSIFGSRLVRS